MWSGPKAVLNQNAVMLRARKHVEQKYLYLWLKQQVFRYLQHQLADPNFYPYIRESDLINWQVPVPSLAEQHRIISYLEDIELKHDSLKRLQNETAAELDALMPAILDRAFKGELC
jgi:type I restriction enzyme S subunit